MSNVALTREGLGPSTATTEMRDTLIRPLEDAEIDQVDGAFLDEFTITLSTTAGGLIGQSVGSRIGASIGFAAGGPVGALVGAGIGFAAGYAAVEYL